MTELFNDLFFIFQRINLLSVIDILLVTLVFFSLLYLLRDTQAMVLFAQTNEALSSALSSVGTQRPLPPAASSFDSNK